MSDSKKVLLVVNPCAGQKKAKRFLADMINVLNRADYRVQTYITAAHGDCQQAIVRYADNVDMVICCGGDGTFNETVAGVMNSGKQLPIGYVPAGSTNDFATSLHLSADLVKATQDIVGGTVVPLDIGSFCGRYFSYVASFGAFTKTSYATPQSNKNLLGHAAYVLNGIQELSQLRTWNLRFEMPDQESVEGEFIFGAITNSTSVGGVLTLGADRVDMADGEMELLLIRKPKDLLELADGIRAIQRQTYDSHMLTFCKASQFHVSAPADMKWTLDGEEEVGHGSIDAQCLRHAIQFVRPPKK